MQGSDEKRNSPGQIVPGGDARAHQEDVRGGARPGVGARRGQPLAPAQGGGYPDSCTILNFRDEAPGRGDPRLGELRKMGLPRVWIDVAELIGIDSFLAMWRRLDREPGLTANDGFMVRIELRPYRSYLRFQRNRYIETLVSAGKGISEIRLAVEEMLGEKVSKRHISRVARGK